MVATPPAPKQWCLPKKETVSSFENWRQNLVYTLLGGATWLKKT